MSNLDNAHRALAEGLQLRAQWHLTAQDWDNYLRAVSDLVTLYENQNETATRLAHMMGTQGQEILRWVDLASHAQTQLVRALEQAQHAAQQMVAANHKREQKQLADLTNELARRT